MPRDARRRPVVRAAGALIDLLESRQMLAATELITNGNFASNGTGWTLAGDFHADAVFSTTNGYSNPGYAYLSASDGTLPSSNNLSGSLRQTVTLPAGVTSANLSFWYKNTSEETAGSNDTVKLSIQNTSGTTLATLSTLYNSTMASYVQAGAFDLTSYAGQTIVISFDGSTNATNGSVFRIDNVSLQADVPPPPAVIVTPTLASPGVPTTTSLPTWNTPVPTVRWNPVANAAGYGVTISKLNAALGTYTLVYNSETGPFTSPIKGTTFTVPAALGAGTYRWTVRAFDANGLATPYALPLYFNLVATGFNRATGIDISHYQTVSSWANIKSNGTTTTTTDDVSFMWAKATEGASYDDAKFTSFVNGARGVGIALGGYHFARPGSNSALTEANHFVSVLNSAGALAAGNLIPMLDFEDTDASSTALGKAALSTWANAFCDRVVTLTGIVPIIYTFTSYATSYINTTVLRYPLWMAQYDSTAVNPATPITSDAPLSTSPWPASTWSVWQYTDKRTVSGVGNVDGDVWNGDVASIAMLTIPSTVKGSVSGTIFNDFNSNGVKDAGEAGIAGRTVYIDADGDGTQDANEQTVVTNANGVYTFANLLAGTYRVREVVPAGFSETTATPVYTFQLTAGQVLGTRDFGTRSTDFTPPAIASSRFNFDQADHSITLVFSEDVGTSLNASNVTLFDVATNAVIPTTFTYSAATRTATFTPTVALANANYRLDISSGSIADATGNATTTSLDVDFFWLTGDANHDRTVNFDDLLTVAQNYGATGRVFANGDFNYDGTVNFDDLLALAQNYGTTLAAAASAPAVVASSIAAPAKKVAATGGKTTKGRVSGDVLA